MSPNDPEFEFSLWPPKVWGKGRLAVLVALVIALAIVLKTDLPDMREWIRLASR